MRRRKAWQLETGVGSPPLLSWLRVRSEVTLILGVKLCQGGSPSTLCLIDKLSCHSNSFSTYHKEEKKIICSVHMAKRAGSLTSQALKLVELQGTEKLQGTRAEEAQGAGRCMLVCTCHFPYLHTHAAHTSGLYNPFQKHANPNTHIHTPTLTRAHTSREVCSYCISLHR